MITLDDHLRSLYNQGIIDANEAIVKSQFPNEMREKLMA